jgi:hypothetical protein
MLESLCANDEGDLGQGKELKDSIIDTQEEKETS